MTDEKNNTGEENTGSRNSGHLNSGDRNSGHWNSGHLNSGHWNSGHLNSGSRNSGHLNSGHWNSGHLNSGSRNSGSRNSGDWNSGDRHAGCFNTTECEGAYFFNKWASFDDWNNALKPDWIYQPSPTSWVAEADMSDAEKVANPTFHTCGGYLRKNDMAEEWRMAKESASEEDIQAVRDLPNFDYDVFEEITGLDLRPTEEKSYAGKVVEIDGKKYRLTEV